MKTVLALGDFLVLNAVAMPFVIADPALLLWYLLCIVLGFVLRLGMENKRHKLTWPVTMWHSICTITWCFVAILFWREFNYKRGFEIYLFLNSLFAAFMVAQLENIGKQTIKDWLRAKLGKFLASETVVNPSAPTDDKETKL